VGFAQRWSPKVGTININIVPVGTSFITPPPHIILANYVISLYINTSFVGTAGTVKIYPSKGVTKLDLSIWYVYASIQLATFPS
jgi:hypothetical protein